MDKKYIITGAVVLFFLANKKMIAYPWPISPTLAFWTCVPPVYIKGIMTKCTCCVMHYDFIYL
jgi:hypothetical protein